MSGIPHQPNRCSPPALPAATTPAVFTDNTAALPTRAATPVPAPAAPVAFHDDSAILRRVIDRLRGLDDWHRPPPAHGVRDRHDLAFRHREARPEAARR